MKVGQKVWVKAEIKQILEDESGFTYICSPIGDNFPMLHSMPVKLGDLMPLETVIADDEFRTRHAD